MTLGFALFTIGLALLVSALKDQTVSDILSGTLGVDVPFGTPKDYTSGDDTISVDSPGGVGDNKAVSPFPKNAKIQWGRSDQGIDGVVKPHTPLRAIYAGTVSIENDPGGFGARYPVLHSANGDFYYGHSVPAVPDGAKVKAGQIIAQANSHGQGNAKTPGAFEIGAWPPGSMSAGQKIRDWLLGLPRL